MHHTTAQQQKRNNVQVAAFYDMPFLRAKEEQRMLPMSSVHKVTPAIATQWLSTNTANRPLSDAAVAKYASAMAKGEWKLNGEPIIFSADGKLMSGQHRLHAVVHSGVTIESLVVTGVEQEVFDTLDTHRPRSAADVLSMKGYTNTRKLASAIRAYIKQLVSYNDARNINNHEIAECIDANPEIAQWFAKYASSKRILPSAVVGIIALIHQLHGLSVAEDFYSKAVLGLNIDVTDPEYLLRERFLNKNTGTTFSQETELALIIKAANARIAGKTIKRLGVKPSEQMPRLTGVMA